MYNNNNNKRRSSIGLGILLIILQLMFTTLKCHPLNKRINCDPSVYDTATKTCIKVYCHSNGRKNEDGYRSIKWDKNSPKLGCTGCHGAPPTTEQHKNASVKTCGQACHRETIKNGYTTSLHINGRIEGKYEEIEKDERDCLGCHSQPQGEYPAIGPAFEMFMDPTFKMSSNHVGGQPMNQDCKVCHMEEFPEYHQNKAVELKNLKVGKQQDRHYYTLDKSIRLEYLNQLEYSEYINQFNQFCLDCHLTAEYLFDPNPFSTARPIPIILNELLYREVLPDELEIARFWYPHNHITEDIFNGEETMNHTDPGSMMNDEIGTPMDNRLNPQQIINNSGPNSMFKNEMKAYLDKGMGDHRGSKQRRRMGVPGIGIGGGMPITVPIIGSTIDPILGSNPAAIITSQPTSIAPVPVMGGGIAPSLGIPGIMQMIPPALTGSGMISQLAPGILGPSPAIVPGGSISMLPGIEIMNMIRSGPGPMIMGPGITPLVSPGSMIMIPVITPGLLPMSGPMLMDPTRRMAPMVVMDKMMTMDPSRMVPMSMYPMMIMDPMRMGPTNMDPMRIMDPMRMGPMNTDTIMNMDTSRMGPMNTDTIMNMDTSRMGPINMDTMRMGPMNMDTYYPKNTDKTDTDNPPEEINQNTSTTSCLTCHTHEDANMLEHSLIIKIFYGHFSHQNCIVCHVPHGSQFPGLLRDRINWDKQNRSCNLEACHIEPFEPFSHKPPLEGTLIHYEIRPEATCNVESCHMGSNYKGVMTGK